MASFSAEQKCLQLWLAMDSNDVGHAGLRSPNLWGSYEGSSRVLAWAASSIMVHRSVACGIVLADTSDALTATAGCEELDDDKSVGRARAESERATCMNIW